LNAAVREFVNSLNPDVDLVCGITFNEKVTLLTAVDMSNYSNKNNNNYIEYNNNIQYNSNNEGLNYCDSFFISY